MEKSFKTITLVCLEQVVLFISDGGSTKGMNPIGVIRDENMKLQNRVVIYTYLLGPGKAIYFCIFCGKGKIFNI